VPTSPGCAGTDGAWITATATGIERGYHLPPEHISVRVIAYRRRTDCNGDYHYTRLRISSRYGHLIVRQTLDCPA
jgi:hypothetical protein